MTANANEIRAIAAGIVTASRKMKQAKSTLDQALSSNTAHAIDWNLQSTRDALEDHPSSPTNYSAAQISNAIGSLAFFVSGHWDIGHGGNYELLLGDTPIV